MTQSPDTDSAAALDDLAFLRNLVSTGSEAQAALGEGYLAGGLLYGLQCFSYWPLAVGWNPPPIFFLVAGFGPTVLFVAVLIWIARRHRQAPTGGATSRAVGATFGSIGVANFALLAIFGSLAARKHSLEIWLIYPCIVFVLQGAAWLAASFLRRRLWQGLVGLGWFAAAVGMSQVLTSPVYVVIATVALLGLMALPGWILMRLARRQA
jgi:hypothetical protein